MKHEKEGLYWTPCGGSGTDLMWASSHEYTSVVKDEQTGKIRQESILVDLGEFVGAENMAVKDEKGKYNKIVPDVSRLVATPGYETDSPKAKAILLTHCHSDHIGGIYEYALMGAKLPPIYASAYTLKILKAGFAARGLDWKKYIEPHVVKTKDVLRFGDISVEVGFAPHSVPGSFCFKITSPKGSIFHSGDIKTERVSYIGEAADFEHFEAMGKGGIDFGVLDACGVKNGGHARTEHQVRTVLVDAFNKEAKGKQAVVVVPPAHVERIATVLQAAKETGRDVVIDGGPIMLTHLMGLEEGELQRKFPNLKSAYDLFDRKNSVLLTCGIHADVSEGSPMVAKIVKGEKYDKMDDDAVVLVGHKSGALKKLFADSGLYPNVSVLNNDDIKGMYGPGHAQRADLSELMMMLNLKCVTPVHTPAKEAKVFNDFVASFKKNGLFTVMPETLHRPTHNGDTVRVVSGRKPQIVSSEMVNAFCCHHEMRSEPIPYPPYEKITISTHDKYDRVSYRDLNINKEPYDISFFKRLEIQAYKELFQATLAERRQMAMYQPAVQSKNTLLGLKSAKGLLKNDGR